MINLTSEQILNGEHELDERDSPDVKSVSDLYSIETKEVRDYIEDREFKAIGIYRASQFESGVLLNESGEPVSVEGADSYDEFRNQYDTVRGSNSDAPLITETGLKMLGEGPVTGSFGRDD